MRVAFLKSSFGLVPKEVSYYLFWNMGKMLLAMRFLVVEDFLFMVKVLLSDILHVLDLLQISLKHDKLLLVEAEINNVWLSFLK